MKTFIATLLIIFSVQFVIAQEKPITILQKTSHEILSAAYSPDGKMVATGGNDNNIILWDVASGTMLNTLKGHSNWVLSLSFSPNGHQLASVSKDMLGKIWDVRSGSEIVTLKGHSGGLACVAYSPDGKSIATGGADATVKVWDAVSGITLRTLGGHTKAVYCIGFSPDGFQLASAGVDRQLKVWDLQTGNLVRTSNAHDGNIRSLAYSPDGKYMATAGDDKLIKLWDSQGVLIKTIKGHSNWVQSLHFSPDSKFLASGGHDFIASIWDVNTGMEVFTTKKLSNIVYDVEFSSDGKTIATACQENVKIWDIKKLNIQGNEASTISKGNSKTSNAGTVDLNFDPAAVGKNYLLIIGVSQYTSWPQLGNAVKDAKDVKRILTSRYTFSPENVVEVYDGQATIEGMYAAINKLKAKIKGNDNLLIYFSGHGFYNAAFDEGYWIPVDAKKGKETDYLPNSTLLKYIKAINTKHTFLVADACFSGALFSDGSRGYIENVEAVKSRWGLTSGRLEYVSDGTSGKNSPFATYFIKYLETNQKKRFTVSELIQYVKVSVSNNSDQTPLGNPLRSVGDEGGEFVFYLK